MSFIRLLTPAPAEYRLDRLTGNGVRHANVVSVSDVDHLAAYVAGSTMTEADWTSRVAAHDPTPDPPRVDPLDELLDAIGAASDFSDLKTRAGEVKNKKEKDK